MAEASKPEVRSASPMWMLAVAESVRGGCFSPRQPNWDEAGVFSSAKQILHSESLVVCFEAGVPWTSRATVQYSFSIDSGIVPARSNPHEGVRDREAL